MADKLNEALEATDNETLTVNPEDNDTKVEDALEVSEADESKTIPFKKYQEEVGKRNNEAQNLRQRLESFESKVSLVQAEKEALQNERDALKEKLQNHELERAVLAAASDAKVGARNPAKLLKLVDRGNITFNEDGSVDGIDTELKRLKKEWAELFINGSADAGQTEQVDVFDMNALLRAGKR